MAYDLDSAHAAIGKVKNDAHASGDTSHFAAAAGGGYEAWKNPTTRGVIIDQLRQMQEKAHG